MVKRKGILWYVFVGSRGGETRMCIVDSLLEKPKNPRELALELDMDYSTITHSLRVLEKNRIVFVPEKKYGANYRIAPEFKSELEKFEALKAHQECTRRDSAKDSKKKRRK